MGEFNFDPLPLFFLWGLKPGAKPRVDKNKNRKILEATKFSFQVLARGLRASPHERDAIVPLLAVFSSVFVCLLVRQPQKFLLYLVVPRALEILVSWKKASFFR